MSRLLSCPLLAVLMAEVVANFLPKLVDMHNYSAAHSIRQKVYNWQTLNRTFGFSFLGFQRLTLTPRCGFPPWSSWAAGVATIAPCLPSIIGCMLRVLWCCVGVRHDVDRCGGGPYSVAVRAQ